MALSLAQSDALRSEVGSDVTTAERLAHFGQIDILILHQDACIARLLSERQQRIVTGVAHHGNAVWLGGYCLAELVGHHADVPAGEDVINRRTEISLGLFRTIKDNRGEQVASISASEETNVDSGSPTCRRSRKWRGVCSPLPPPGESHSSPRGASTQQCSSIEPARKCADTVEFPFRHDSLLRT